MNAQPVNESALALVCQPDIFSLARLIFSTTKLSVHEPVLAPPTRLACRVTLSHGDQTGGYKYRKVPWHPSGEGRYERMSPVSYAPVLILVLILTYSLVQNPLALFSSNQYENHTYLWVVDPHVPRHSQGAGGLFSLTYRPDSTTDLSTFVVSG